MITEEMIKVNTRIGSINPKRAKKFGMINDLLQSFSQDDITMKNMKSVAIRNGKGTIVPVLGIQAS